MESDIRPTSYGILWGILPGLKSVIVREVVCWFPIIEYFRNPKISFWYVSEEVSVVLTFITIRNCRVSSREQADSK